MDKDSFVELVRVHLSCYAMKLKISKTKTVKSGISDVSGYFCDDEGITVAGKSSRWFGILIHEYCHFIQWVENFIGYSKFDKHYVGWDGWLSKKRNLKKKDLHIKFLAIRNLELDCEIRTVKMIKKYNLPVNIPKYIQGANAYMFFYAYVKKHRLWPNKKINKKLNDIQPTRFLRPNKYNKMTKEFEELMTKYCV